MPAEPLNDQQTEYLESQLTLWRRLGMDRPPKRQSLIVSIRVSELGREVSSQEVGRWFSNRVKDDRGQPRQTKKTPEQLAVLEASFEMDCTPSVQEQIWLIQETGLTRRQIVSWFDYQRKKLEDEPGVYVERYYPTDEEVKDMAARANQAAAQWREYRKAGGKGAE
ncbi:uncharacterized protein EV420DRAFT_1538535 [Desarmillaria tabescens]|uniref:Homeobox domain-containing protein n=1 Tax=Armillaria tabescens TaxID=1929756 RepID=A0AA39N6E3_ARMTA|nr:uncharacterized protein EV420DRAFT_1538535 [Desarmillaria tabescens]KAK0459139.1 hypothetical protein EV420DRAFT_1538535 [Desarmillaria tabescens]